VLIPEENAKDLAEIPENVKSGLKIIPVKHMDEVLAHALTAKPTPIVWDETTAGKDGQVLPEEEPAGMVAH
jgi:ATP-dependent Lon protease